MANKLRPVPPGEVLVKEFLNPLGITQYRLAKDINVPPRRINEIVLGKRAVSADTALRLSKYFGNSAEFWLNLQARYDLEIQKETIASELKKQVSFMRAVKKPKIKMLNKPISIFCRRHHIRRLAFFGSVLRDDFGPTSDVDVLVEFELGHVPGLIRLAGMEMELAKILKRTVELRTPSELSPYFRGEVLKTAEVAYDVAA